MLAGLFVGSMEDEIEGGLDVEGGLEVEGGLAMGKKISQVTNAEERKARTKKDGRTRCVRSISGV